MSHAHEMGRHRTPMSAELRALEKRLREVASTQGGVITAEQCHRLGADTAAIRWLLAGGGWRRLRRGVYGDAAFRARDRTGHLHRCAAVMAGLRTTAAVVSHTSAARVLGLPLPPRVDPRVTLTRRPPAPTSGPRSSTTVEVGVHLAHYDDADVVLVDGVSVLAGARLVLDCCDAMPPDSALAVADAALGRGITSLARLWAELEHRRGRPRTKLARLVVERSDGLAESWFESSSRWWLLESGLPRPELQVRFADERGLVVAKVDMLMRVAGTVGEADGAGKYDEPGSLFAEKQREDWLRDSHRLEVVRWVPQEMRTPTGRAHVVHRFWRAFARGRRAS